MVKAKNRVGEKFNQLTILSIYGDGRRSFAEVLCVCGNKKQRVALDKIVSGRTKNCGCDAGKKFPVSVGEKINKLLILSLFRSGSRNSLFANVLCECGKETAVRVDCIVSSNTTSCGCEKKVGKFKHGLYTHRLYGVWEAMKRRCTNENDTGYHNYGGRGVKICDEWKDDFIPFYNWAIANGYKKGLTIDKDIKGDGLLYSPETCCFVTSKVNNNHSRNNRRFDYNGRMLSLSQISDMANVDYGTIKQRVYNGWDLNRAINTPRRKIK